MAFTSSHHNMRAFQRHFANAAIRFRINGEKDIFSASLKNYSKGGVGFISEVSVPGDAQINIAMPALNFPGFTPIYSTEAKVVWNRPYSENRENPLYEAGTKWVSHTCDWCQEQVLTPHLCQTDDLIFLCHGCQNELAHHLSGKLKDTMHRYLLGNVL